MRNRWLSFITALFFLLGVPASTVALDRDDTVLITGANRGIGLELATQLRAMDINVIGTARKPEAADALRATGARVEQLDVADPASVAALAQTLSDVEIDVLINNAGVRGQSAGTLEDLDLEQFARVFSINSTGPLRVTQALLPNLRAGDGKTIVQISSVMGSIEQNRGGSYDYRASKTALNMLNKSLAIELRSEGIVCVVLHPGWVRTRMGGESAPVSVQDSVAGLVEVIADLEPANSGGFFDYQGNPLPW